MRRLAAVLLLTLALASVASAQGVVVAPHAIYLDHRTRSGSITLYNPGAEPTEVAIASFFGYPVTDSAGHFVLQTPDSVEPGMPAASTWIEAFPRRMILGPLQRQTIRLLARPPQGLADGEYWSRVAISAKGGSLDLAGADSAGIQIGLTLEVKTIIPLIYRKGALQTGVRLGPITARRNGDSLIVRARLERQGTAAFVGTARGALVDGRGRTVATVEQPVAIYYDAEPAFMIPIAGQSAGSYRLRLEVTSDRSDIAPDLLLRAAPVRDSVTVELP